MTSVDSKRERAAQLKLLWLLTCGLGEMAGLGAALAVGAAAALVVGAPSGAGGRVLVLALMVAAGALEGLIVGHFQGRILSRLMPRFPHGRYLTATAAAAAFGWAVGVSTPLFFIETGFDAETSWRATATTLLVVAGLGALLGLLFGGAQALALDGAAKNRRLWVMGNAVGWAAGLPFVALFPSLLPDGTPVAAVVVTGAIGGLIAGAWVAVATAPVVVSMKASPTTPRPEPSRCMPGRSVDGAVGDHPSRAGQQKVSSKRGGAASNTGWPATSIQAWATKGRPVGDDDTEDDGATPMTKRASTRAWRRAA